MTSCTGGGSFRILVNLLRAATMVITLSPTSIATSVNFRYFAIWNCLWISILPSIFKKSTFTSAIIVNPSILLPGEANSSVPRLTYFECPQSDPQLYYRAVIGILSHPGDGASGRLSNATSASYIAASYVKLVESGGARVMPLIYNEPREILLKKVNLVNGVLFTGGWAKTGLYFDTVKEIFKKVLEQNDAGHYFPCYAICLGFELLSMIISEDNEILETFEGHNQASTLQFVRDADIEGTVFQRFHPELLKKMTTNCLAMQNHGYGISPERLEGNQRLSSFFNVVTTSTDKEDKVYVSTVQAHNYPVTGFQWHPEKNAFEWGSSMIPHSGDAIEVTQHVANFFISEGRKSWNRPSASEVLDNLIYNYKLTYSGKEGKGYDELYIFQ